MSWKCLFFHKFKEIRCNPVSVYEEGTGTEIPIEQYTIFLYECKRCKFKKSQRIDGYFCTDDDDDDSDDPPPSPVLSLDNY